MILTLFAVVFLVFGLVKESFDEAAAKGYAIKKDRELSKLDPWERARQEHKEGAISSSYDVIIAGEKYSSWSRRDVYLNEIYWESGLHLEDFYVLAIMEYRKSLSKPSWGHISDLVNYNYIDTWNNLVERDGTYICAPAYRATEIYRNSTEEQRRRLETYSYLFKKDTFLIV